MSSVVLCQSGLYSSAVILALNRGAHMDAYGSLIAVTNQEFGMCEIFDQSDIGNDQ